jgi:hypothetical protein
MAASKPIFLSSYIKTFLFSLNNNFGTLTLALGCFPFDIQPYHSMSDNSRFILSVPSYKPTGKIFTIPQHMLQQNDIHSKSMKFIHFL